MTEFLRSNLEIYFIENPFDAEKIGEQVLLNKRSREKAEETRLNVKKKLSGSVDIANRVRSSWTAAPRTWTSGRSTSWRATAPWAA